MESVEQILDLIKRDGMEKMAKGRFENDDYLTYRTSYVKDILKHLEVSTSDLDSLNVIHVAGSKGKGSTCTFIESILRGSGYKTGFFLSPHTLKVTERITINGKSIENEKFVKLFQRLWKGKGKSICEEYYSSCYFLVFFCMAIRAFVDEDVDVAIIEVGQGGEYDLTNIFSKPVVCAVTLLELEHTEVLGKTLESIAWHKSGIFQPGCSAFTIPQLPSAMSVLKSRAAEKNCHLSVAHGLSHYEKEWNRKIVLGLDTECQKINASLAIEVCECWMRKMTKIHSNNKDILPSKEIRNFIQGLKNAKLLGRQQINETNGITFYLDVAHTKISLENALRWFEKTSTKAQTTIGRNCKRILVLSINGKRDLPTLLNTFSFFHFDYVAITASVILSEKKIISYDGYDQNCFKENAKKVAMAWGKIFGDEQGKICKKFESINEVIAWIAKGRDEKLHSRVSVMLNGRQQEQLEPDVHLQVFVTGSVRLICGLVTLLPELVC